MRTSSGGMQTAAANPSIYCPKCGKPAARKVIGLNFEDYLHFTKKGYVWHFVLIKKEANDGQEYD